MQNCMLLCVYPQSIYLTSHVMISLSVFAQIKRQKFEPGKFWKQGYIGQGYIQFLELAIIADPIPQVMIKVCTECLLH